MRKGVCPNPIPVGRDPPGVLRSMVRAAAWVIDGIALIRNPGGVIRHPRFPVPGSVTTRSG